ncbi:MAG TPA: tyrosine-type recombinase/integrase [Streptosporangiaceae bacterium]|nr:tyrosine-type recombinase/integrase [Streptosporangiaceae bacterium]
MGYVRQRSGKDGRPRYTAYFRDVRGGHRSASTFALRRDAERAWRRAEAAASEGRVVDLRWRRQTFEHYVTQVWMPHHVVEPVTVQGYVGMLERYLLPEFGPMRMSEILPAHLRAWITALTDRGVGVSVIRKSKNILGAIFTTAVNDQVISWHPCAGVKAPPLPRRVLRIVTPAEFDRLLGAFADARMALLAETAVESGLRWGELIELRPRDLEVAAGMLTVSRVALELRPRFHPDGGRFLVRGYPKDKEWRRLRLSGHIMERLSEHIDHYQIAAGALLFPYPGPTPASLVASTDGEAGLTAPNEAGRRHRHGTLTAYSAGRCRCEVCRAAYARYRAERRAAGKDSPRPGRMWDTDGHIPGDWFRKTIWHPAVRASGIGVVVRPRDLRHAHASWLLAGGADLQTVRERLGHGSIRTTEQYLHTLPDTDDTALTALARIRSIRP